MKCLPERLLYLLLSKFLVQPHAWRTGKRAKVKVQFFLNLQNIHGSYTIFQDTHMPYYDEWVNLNAIEASVFQNLKQALLCRLCKLFCVTSWRVIPGHVTT